MPRPVPIACAPVACARAAIAATSSANRPCRDQRTWLQVMRDRPWAALCRRCRRLPPPVVVTESWLGETGLMAHVATVQQGTLLVEGKPA